eukprot:gnl/Dysnectes_brevis/8001_a13930_335.p1 GENE.gnl/Dysnectes_brevis/8001_a13930_335~~gnl/Dysnectes_brevis/8001_a13930_335.p1  ORF type:complete len:254 (-),score=47.40 gnl/Dysnectes_brevis/8001_a13930_335:115-774(-)
MKVDQYVSSELESIHVHVTKHSDFMTDAHHRLKEATEAVIERKQSLSTHRTEVEISSQKASNVRRELSKLREQIELLEQETRGLTRRRDELHNAIASKKLLLTTPDAPPTGTQEGAKPPPDQDAGLWRFEHYRDSLGLQFSNPDDESIRLTFSCLYPAHPALTQHVTFRLGGEGYEVTDSSTPIPHLVEMLTDANMTNNFSLLVRRIRAAFQQMTPHVQ